MRTCSASRRQKTNCAVRISKGAIADALGISRMSLTRKINNVTEFKASEISLLKTILRLDDQERDKIFFANYVD